MHENIAIASKYAIAAQNNNFPKFGFDCMYYQDVQDLSFERK